jgi:uncharacterized protein
MNTSAAVDLQANKAVARAFIEALSAGELDEAFAMTSPTSVIWLPHPRQALTFGQWRGVYEALMENQFPQGCRYEIGHVTAEDNRVAVVTESFAPMRNGELYNNRYHWLFTIDGGQIAGCEEFMDSLYAHKTIHAAGWAGRTEN